MHNRQERRQLKREGLAFTPKQEAVINAAIQQNYELGIQKGRGQAIKMCFAGVCLALHDVCGFGGTRVKRVLQQMEHHILETLSSEEAMDKVFEEIGLRISFSNPFGYLEEVEAKECASVNAEPTCNGAGDTKPGTGSAASVEQKTK